MDTGVRAVIDQRSGVVARIYRRLTKRDQPTHGEK